MSNDFFNHTDRLTPGVTARSSDVNGLFDSVAQGFDLLPSVAAIRYSTSNFATASGTDNYTVTLSPVLAEYYDGMELAIRVSNTNTGAASVNVNGLGARSIYRSDGSPLGIGDILADSVTVLRYDLATISFWIVSNIPALANEAAASAAEAEVWAQQANPTGFIELYNAVITANTTVAPTGYNGFTSGPTTIANGVTVTVADGSVWTVG